MIILYKARLNIVGEKSAISIIIISSSKCHTQINVDRPDKCRASLLAWNEGTSVDPLLLTCIEVRAQFFYSRFRAQLLFFLSF